jgi:transposase
MGRDGKMDVQIGVSKEVYAGRLDVIAGPTGRQQRSDAEKARIAAESLAPDAVVSDVARGHGVTRGECRDFAQGRASRAPSGNRQALWPGKLAG